MEFAKNFGYALNMPNETFLDKIAKLPLSLKLTGAGALLMVISVFLPWYADIDAFNTGDQFLGITGPLYLLGFLILAMAVFSLALTGYRVFEKKMPDLPLEESHSHVFVGVMSLFLLVITSSIYFHSKFGVNITMKEVKIGMVLALIGSVFTLFGGIKIGREKEVSFDADGHLDRLIDVGEPMRVQRDIKVQVQEPASEEKEEVATINIESNNDTLL